MVTHHSFIRYTGRKQPGQDSQRLRKTRSLVRDQKKQETQMNPPSFSGQGEYEIVVKGHLDEQLSYWFEDLTMSTGYSEDGTPITTLAGRFVDQAALHGVLATIRDINMPLISVSQVEKDSQDGS
jgi:hypothetical protein